MAKIKYCFKNLTNNGIYNYLTHNINTAYSYVTHNKFYKCLRRNKLNKDFDNNLNIDYLKANKFSLSEFTKTHSSTIKGLCIHAKWSNVVSHIKCWS